MTIIQDHAAEKEKRVVAMSSVLAAVFITTFKLIIGLLTHSLGILAEAAHSALDLVAAAVTLLAVRISGRPPDQTHTYGHGKVENLSALFEAFLLLVTCAWIIYEAVDRLFFKSVQVEVSIWSFVVMLTSITIDVTRSRALMKAAKKHSSQALEADALHFSTDVWSSAVVIGGLVLITLAEWLQGQAWAPQSVVVWLFRADAIAALGVSIIVIYVSVELGKRTIDGLLDTAPKGMQAGIEQLVSEVPGVLKVIQTRIRPSGPHTFVDLILAVPRGTGIESGQNINERVRTAISQVYPKMDVIIDLVPTVQDENSVNELVLSIAGKEDVHVHSMRTYIVEDSLNLDLHLEVPENMTLEEAHKKATAFETQVKAELPTVHEIVTHIEPVGEKEAFANDTKPDDSETIRKEIIKIVEETPGVSHCHRVTIWQSEHSFSTSFHCIMEPQVSIREAHNLTTQVEQALRKEMPELKRVVIHVEPNSTGVDWKGVPLK